MNDSRKNQLKSILGDYKKRILVKYANTYSSVQRKKLTDNKTKEYRVTTQKLTIPAKANMNRNYPLIIFDSMTFEMFLKHVCGLDEENIEIIINELDIPKLMQEYQYNIQKGWK